jgi:hypothetical protein
MITQNQIEDALKDVLLASGSDLRHYTMPGRLQMMGDAMSCHLSVAYSNGKVTGFKDAMNMRPKVIDCKEESGVKKKAEKPDSVSHQVWSDFLEVRKTKKAPLTYTALAGIEREAKKANMTTEAALIKCCEMAWVGFKSEWVLPRYTVKAMSQHNGAAGAIFDGLHHV